MINETVILLAPLQYRVEHRLSKYKYVESYLVTTIHSKLYYYEPLQKIFSKVIAYDYPKRLAEIGVKGINEEVINLVRKAHPKYAIWISANYEFRESTFDITRKEGAAVVGLFFDDELRFDTYSKWWIPHLDYCVTNTIEAVSRYRELNARCILAVPIMGGVRVGRDWSNIEEKYDISFVGTITPGRKQYINELKNRNIPTHLFGGSGKYVSFEKMIDIFKSSRINLNFSKAWGCSKKLQIKGRIFEVCLAGGFLLTEYVPGIENYFEIDKEIVCFHNTEEMVDKIIYYLNHDEERRSIAQSGWRRATSEYTSFHIMSRVFQEIEENSSEGQKNMLKQLKMPLQIRKRFSNYYLNWGVAFLLENCKSLWKDALVLSISYNPLNIRAWYCHIVGFLPSLMRPPLLKWYKTIGKLRRALFSWVGSIPYLKNEN